MKKSLFVMLIALLCASAYSLSAQNKFAVELRSGAALAVQDLGDANLNPGFGFEGLLDYQFMPSLSVYAGWGWNRFSSDDESFAGKDVDFEETGYLFGLQFNQPLGDGPLAIYLRGGGIYNHIETENNAGDITADSGHGLGWRLGAGLAVSLGDHWLLKPGVKYQSLSRDIKVEGTTTAVDLNYLSVGVGLARKF